MLSYFGLVVLVVLAVLVYFTGYEAGHFTSPLPRDEKQVGLNLWFPKDQEKSALVLGERTDVLTAKSAIFVDSKSGQLLFAKDIHKKVPIASLTKVMTAVVALEHRNLDEKYAVSARAAEFEPDKMFLIAGESLTLKELLYGLFLISANDAAEVLAEGTLGDREKFIKLMNNKAQQLGMRNTYFVNPTGLDEDNGNSYSTAYDLAILTRYAIRHFPALTEITQTVHKFLPKTSDHQDYDMYSGINLLTTYPGVYGFKTGYTPSAGLTLITLARSGGSEVIGVLLGSANRREEARELLDYSFERLKAAAN